MRPYETLVVLNPELGEGVGVLVSKFESVIRDGGGKLDASHSWGVRELAYSIGKQATGHFFLIEYNAEPPVVKELERTMRITDGVMRFISVQQEHTGLPEDRRQESPSHDSTPMSDLRSSPPRGPRPSPSGRVDPKPEPAARDEATAASGESGTDGKAN